MSKKDGKFHQNDVKRIKKLKNIFFNIIKNVKIYGTRESENIIDIWMYSELEKFKAKISNFLEKYDFGDLVRNYENLVYNISRVYMQILRKNKINSQIFAEFLIVSYPFFPSTAKKLSDELGVNLNDFKIGKFSINQMVEKIIVEIRNAKREILKLKVKKEINISLPIKKIIIQVDFKYLPMLVNIKQELMNYFNAYSIEITDKWQGLEYKAKLKKENLGEIYKPIANVIENVLSKIDAKKMKEEIEKHNYEIGIEGNLIIITPQMVDFVYELPENFEMIELPNMKIFVNLEIDKDVQNFDIVRKLSRHIALMRKRANVEYDDLIDVSISNSMVIKNSLKNYIKKFKEDLKIRNINFSDIFKEMLVLSFNDIVEGEIDIGISPLYRKYRIKAFSKLPGLTLEEAENLFNAGFITIDDLRKGDGKIISEKSKIPLSKVKIIKDFVENMSSMRVIEMKGKYYCPMCETELNIDEKICTVCHTQLEWP